MLSKALARSIDCSVRRVQFTPDLLPSDITGVSVYNQEVRDFEFRPGAVFANVVVGDEINRASPKTQSALLECMEEGHVTVDGTTYPLQTPFMVMATQNPIEMEGTYPLPEAQRDRFMARISVGYPSPSAELLMLDSHGGAFPLERLTPVTDGDTVAKLIETVRTIYASDGRQAVRRRPGHRDRGRRRRCAWAPHRGPACTCSARRAPTPPSPAGTTSCRTTCRPWSCRSSPTASSPPARPSWPGGPPPTCCTSWSAGSRSARREPVRRARGIRGRHPAGGRRDEPGR